VEEGNVIVKPTLYAHGWIPTQPVRRKRSVFKAERRLNTEPPPPPPQPRLFKDAVAAGAVVVVVPMATTLAPATGRATILTLILTLRTLRAP
jgi:hypothetical protein